jgi:hypothetical protein
MTGYGPGEAPFPREPLPTVQSVLWRPTIQELAHPDSDLSPIFLAQRAVAAVEEHLRAAPEQTLVGFLVGRVYATPDTGTPYVVVHGAVRVPQAIVAGATEPVVGQSLGAAQRALSPEHGVVVGWYRSDPPPGALRITPDDHQAHVQHFHRPWQIALLVSIRPAPVGVRGGVFRPVGPVGSPVPYLPFYELLDAENDRDGWKRPYVAWSTYWSPDPAVWRLRPSPQPHTEPPAPSPRPRRITPIPPNQGDDFHVAWRGPRSHVAGRWWILGGTVLVAAVWLGIRLGAGGAVPVTASTSPESRAPSPQSSPQSSPESRAPSPQPVLQSLDAYRLRSRLFANRQMTCAELGQGLADLDDAWLRYTMAKTQTAGAGAAPGDTTLTPAERQLAANVDSVEADFERSGCPRP